MLNLRLRTISPVEENVEQLAFIHSTGSSIKWNPSNIQSDENQGPTTKTTLPSKVTV